MSARSKIYRFRLTPAEQDRLDREARERGLASKADRIREALGWDTQGQKATVSPGPAAAASVLAKPPEGPPADPDREPGKAGIEALAKRISGGEGVPMRVARSRAKERLDPSG